MTFQPSMDGRACIGPGQQTLKHSRLQRDKAVPILTQRWAGLMAPMKSRAATLAILGATVVGSFALLALGVDFGRAETLAPRMSFLIATGPSGGTYFPVGQTIAGIISNPPGSDRCQVSDACGPQGLIASARTSDGAVENVLAVNAGNVDSALAQADVVSDAERGR